MNKSVAIRAVALVTAGIAWPPVARADDSDQFNQYMNSHGYWQRSYLQDGYDTCTALRSGQSTTSVINQLESQVSVAEATDIVFAARRYLCPGV